MATNDPTNDADRGEPVIFFRPRHSRIDSWTAVLEPRIAHNQVVVKLTLKRRTGEWPLDSSPEILKPGSFDTDVAHLLPGVFFC